MEITGRDHFEDCTDTSYQFNIRDIQLAFLFCCTLFYCMLLQVNEQENMFLRDEVIIVERSSDP